MEQNKTESNINVLPRSNADGIWVHYMHVLIIMNKASDINIILTLGFFFYFLFFYFFVVFVCLAERKRRRNYNDSRRQRKHLLLTTSAAKEFFGKHCNNVNFPFSYHARIKIIYSR